MPFFNLTSKSTQCRARTGLIHTAHGDIETPIFMPVGTQATVKSLDPIDLNNIGAQIILSNTYHLHLRPGEDLIAEFGGLHKFMGWNKPILTDSGGFQVFSLKNLRKNEDNQHNQGRLVNIDDEGVTFHSHLDGSTHRFTPESAIEIQHKLGADIIMAFDECTGDDVSYDVAKVAMNRTHQWAKRCLDYHKNKTKQHLFGIIQGSNYKDLREESAHYISSLDFDGIAIGGESVGFNMEATKNILDWVVPLIPENKPHYTMGVGSSPLDLFEVVERGIDMFDCVSPTRMARNGALFVRNQKNYRININNACYANDHGPIDPTCTCYTCSPRRSPDLVGTKAGQTFSRAYLNHLFKAEELLAYRLATIHNLHFLLDLMKQMRQAIKEDKFLELKKQWI